MIRFDQPIRDGIARTRRILFPFLFRRWMPLAFCAWLAAWCQGGSHAFGDSSVVNGKILSHPFVVHTGPGAFQTAMIFGVPVAFLALGILTAWLASRGSFMLLDNVIHDRALIAAPWGKFRTPGNDLFLFNLIIMIAEAGVALVLAVITPGLAKIETLGVILLSLFAVFVLLAALPLFIFLLYFGDFAVPIMYKTRCNPVVAVVRIWQIISSRPQAAFVYLLLRLALGLVTVVVTFLIGRITFSLGLLPFVLSCLLLPLTVFRQSFILDCLRQFDPALDLWPKAAPPPVPDVS